MALIRKEHWDTIHFHDFLESRRSTAYQYSIHDCATFAADGILAQTGIDIAEEFRSRYKSATGAQRIIKKLTGGSTIADAAAYCASKHGLTELEHPLKAQRGDLVIVEQDGTPIAGLVHLNGRTVAVPGDNGWILLPITDVKRAWRIA